jgi:ppGpp synthetase/RelA/SpoT-type nucleotidyltranferase
MGEEVESCNITEYERVTALAELASQAVRKHIEQALRALGDPYLVRGRIEESRIKSLASVRRKAQQRRWTFDQALRTAEDLVGFRLACNNLQDVLRCADLLQASLQREGQKVHKRDYIARPKPDGYRAIHLVFPYSAKMGGNEATFGCEVQIRSLLQDSWAKLSHDDIYVNQESVAPAIARDMRSLSLLLARADTVAERIRRRVSAPRKGRNPGAGEVLTSSALAFVYRRAFGQDPPGYLVESIRREFGGYKLRADGLETALGDNDFMNRLRTAYNEQADWEPASEQCFRWAVLSLAVGREAAIRRARSEARAEWREISIIARSEAMASVPQPEDMLSELEQPAKDEDPEYNLETWASGLGATSRCALCGTTIVDPDDFVDAAVRFYRLRGRKAEQTRERLRDAAQSLAIETGSWDNPSLCGYCSNMLNKDD